MLIHHLKLIIRNIFRKPVHTIINLIGLSVSLTVVIIISGYCYNELNADKFHNDLNRIYLVSPASFLERDKRFINTPGALYDEIITKVNGVESAVRVKDPWNPVTLQRVDNSPIVTDLMYADSTFFNVFTYQALYGDLTHALKEPMSIVLTEDEAKKLFGNNLSVGKTLRADNRFDYTVTAVIKNPSVK